jgi:hypothetical protein
LQGEFVFSTEEVLRIVRKAREKPKGKRPRGRPRKRSIEEVEEVEEEEEVENSSSESELDSINCVARRTRSKLEN